MDYEARQVAYGEGANAREPISNALDITNEMNSQATDGTRLEDLTVQAGPLIRVPSLGSPH